MLPPEPPRQLQLADLLAFLSQFAYNRPVQTRGPVPFGQSVPPQPPIVPIGAPPPQYPISPFGIRPGYGALSVRSMAAGGHRRLPPFAHSAPPFAHSAPPAALVEMGRRWRAAIASLPPPRYTEDVYY